MIEYCFKARENAAKLELDVSRKKNIKKKNNKRTNNYKRYLSANKDISILFIY